MFETLLIANRGEIACRITRTAQRLGMRVIAVYSDADAGALHTRVADAAVRIGPASARESYLNIPALLRAAIAAGRFANYLAATKVQWQTKRDVNVEKS